MKLTKDFSLAQRINIEISGQATKDCVKFLNNIYENFEKKLDNPDYTLKVIVTDKIPKINKVVSLGKDAYYNENTLILNSGHFFIRENDKTLTVGIPFRVKRGRIPFKRNTSGRHITDEIVEPLTNLILLNCDAAFVHASSIYSNGKADILMGWRGTGKTNAILKDFESKDIWSDDLAIIDSNGFVYPYLRPIRLYAYNLALLNKKYIKDHKLNFKSKITPPWRPVHYLPLKKKASVKKAELRSITYLNNPDTKNIAEDAEDIMIFEQSFFEHYKIMLQHSGIFSVKKSVKEILNNL
ncbi:MAG: hypothetical protein R2816_01335 [Flavobacteriaceae bacterium]|nr:hypothetical protein [Flavobacteriaceae bacterium]